MTSAAMLPGGFGDTREHLGRNLTTGMMEIVGRAVVAGEFQEHPFPNEADLSRHHGVSRSVTREVTKMLAAKGLLGARPRQGTFVRPHDHWNLFDGDVLRWLQSRSPSALLALQFNELRLAVEPHAASLMADHGAPALRSDLLASLNAIHAAAFDDELEELAIRFHQIVLIGSGNPFMARLTEGTAGAIRCTARVLRRTNLPLHEVDDLVTIHDAIDKGDGHAAACAVSVMIGRLISRLQSSITSRNEGH